MSTTMTTRPTDGEDGLPAIDRDTVDRHPSTGEEAPTEPRRTPAGRTVLLTCAAALLAGAAAGWMTAGVFTGSAARVVALLGAVVGAGHVAISYRLGRPATLQYLTIPVALLVAGAVVIVDQGTTADLARLVTDALFSGGIGQPPVPFDPGWRFLLTLLTVLLTAGAAAVAIGFDRPNLAVGIPVPLVFAASLVQPSGAETLSTVVSFVLVIAALAIAYGVELAETGVSSGRFEVLRLVRGAGALVALAVGLVVLANTASFLLPEATADQVVPPQRPPTAPPQSDRLLFTVESDRRLPWRLGVLDVYEDGAWKTPPFDPARLVDLPATADELPGETGSTEETVTVTFTAADLGGRILPTLAAPHRIVIEGGDGIVQYDPRTQSLRLDQRVQSGFTYTVTASTPPTSDELAAAPPPSDDMAEFLTVPPAPPAVQDLLADAPTTNLFERLQFVRQAFYDRVLAAGAGDPVDVPPERVVEILDGQEATPYEITAAEALLARWAGVPARLGYGYFGGIDEADGLAVRPRHGSTYLEVYFEGEGWTPIVGKPPRAKSSFTDTEKNEDPAVRPTDELALITYVPVRLESLTLLFELVRFYLAQIIPVVILAILAIAFYPGLLRTVRRWRRRRWAADHGPAGRIAVAYAELRDTAWDLNIGQPSQTPLEFVHEIAPDDEHTELAWLVTRALWGDLARDLQPPDAEAAEEAAASVARRLRAAQSTVTRILAVTSRASLRSPFSDELPNAWRSLGLTRRLRRSARALTKALRRPLRLLDPRRLTRAVRQGVTSVLPLLLVALTLLLTACSAPLDLSSPADPAILPDPAVPGDLDGISFQREPSAEVAYDEGGDAALVTTGQVYSVRRDDTIEASLQIAALRPGLTGREDDVRRGILASLGGGRFEPTRLGDQRIHVLESVEQRMLLWFSPDGRFYELLVARKAFAEADALFEAVLAFQHGADVDGLGRIQHLEAPDPRRGFPA